MEPFIRWFNFVVFKQKTAYEMRISDWSSDVCSSDLDRARAWTRVKIAKHFLPYKYDYRSEWLRFIRTVGIARTGYGELPERVIRAVATIVDSPGGLLFTLGDGRDFAPLAHWNMPWSEARPVDGGHPMIAQMARDGRIGSLDEHRDDSGIAGRPPHWLLDDRRAWLIVQIGRAHV